MRRKKCMYSPELTYDEKWLAIMFLEDILRKLSDIQPTEKNGITERVFVKVVPYCGSHERSMFFKFIKYINSHPSHLWDSVKKCSGGLAKYSRLLINDSDEVGYVDISLFYRT